MFFELELFTDYFLVKSTTSKLNYSIVYFNYLLLNQLQSTRKNYDNQLIIKFLQNI